MSACSTTAADTAGHKPRYQVSIISDSFTAGGEQGGLGPNGWPALARKTLENEGVDADFHYAPEGGAGYATVGSFGGTFGDQVRAVVGVADDLVVFFGSTNDGDAPPDKLRAAVGEDFAKAKELALHAKLLIIGPTWPTPDPPPTLVAVRDILREQASAAGATFVDPLAEHWIADQPQLIGWDGIHPTDEGHKYLANKIAPLIGAMLTSG